MNSDVKRVADAASQWLLDILEVAGAMVESTAIDEALVDTGYYKGSMYHLVDDEAMAVFIGAHAEYAAHIETRYKPVLQIALTQNLGNIRRLAREKSI